MLELGLKQSEVAKLLWRTHGFISRVENGSHRRDGD
jgi:hypothetical protein